MKPTPNTSQCLNSLATTLSRNRVSLVARMEQKKNSKTTEPRKAQLFICHDGT